MEAKKHVRRSYSKVAFVTLFATTLTSLVDAASASEFEKAFKRDPVCWHYVNAAEEEFLLKLRALSLGGTSFIVSDVLAGEEGRYPKKPVAPASSED